MSERERQEIHRAEVRRYSQNLNCNFGPRDVVPHGAPAVLLLLPVGFFPSFFV